jgi:hypothetical protein
MSSQLRSLIRYVAVAAVWAASSGGQAQIAARGDSPPHFQARAVPLDVRTADSLQSVPVHGMHPPLDGLPGVPYASVAAGRMKVAGKLEATALSASFLSGDGSALRMYPNAPPISMGALRLEPVLRLTLTTPAGPDYLVVCRVTPGSYSVRDAVRPAGMVQTYLADADGYLAFVLEDAVAGESVFEIESGTPWGWSGCEVRTLT